MRFDIENNDTLDSTVNDDNGIVTTGGKGGFIETTDAPPLRVKHSDRGMIPLPNGHKRYMEPIR